MSVETTIERASVDELLLDPKNPRLGRINTRKDLHQHEVLRLMEKWNLEELAISFLRSGFWAQEALLVTQEAVPGVPEPGLVVIEGNRRLAALKHLHAASQPDAPDSKWQRLLSLHQPRPELFTQIPYIRVAARGDVEAFVGFRHVTGILHWHPAEKAEFITKLIEDRGLSYEEVMQLIGSKTPVVRQSYIAFNLLRQMEEAANVDVRRVEDKFSVLFMSLRSAGIRNYLGVDPNADVDRARHPVKKSDAPKLTHLARWLFGDESHPPVLKESRDIDDFGRVLGTEEGREYLEKAENPTWDVARQIAGIGVDDLIQLINEASDGVDVTLVKAHQFLTSERLAAAIERLATRVAKLHEKFKKS
jgi:hypothetical protein